MGDICPAIFSHHALTRWIFAKKDRHWAHHIDVLLQKRSDDYITKISGVSWTACWYNQLHYSLVGTDHNFWDLSHRKYLLGEIKYLVMSKVLATHSVSKRWYRLIYSHCQLAQANKNIQKMSFTLASFNT